MPFLTREWTKTVLFILSHGGAVRSTRSLGLADRHVLRHPDSILVLPAWGPGHGHARLGGLTSLTLALTPMFVFFQRNANAKSVGLFCFGGNGHRPPALWVGFVCSWQPAPTQTPFVSLPNSLSFHLSSRTCRTWISEKQIKGEGLAISSLHLLGACCCQSRTPACSPAPEVSEPPRL